MRIFAGIGGWDEFEGGYDRFWKRINKRLTKAANKAGRLVQRQAKKTSCLLLIGPGGLLRGL